MSAEFPDPWPRIPDDDKPPVEEKPRSGAGIVALKVLAGFLAAPLAFALCAPARSAAPAVLLALACLLMLFFSATRAIVLGALLFTGVAFLVLLAICSGSHF
ncbi:MAG: hypothetical protein JF599_03645 [Verrucomicrobia bacterium]|nr:hypothetical protein [Verrucomicrobiota bacterium]